MHGRRTSAIVWALLLATAAALPGCLDFGDAGSGHPPVARASASPMAIPENDGFQTPVTLDASESADPFDDPTGEFPLAVKWRISGDEFRFETGDEDDPMPVLRFRGDRPATIELEITDADGQSTTTHFTMQLSVTL